jgi:hypothetical protein
MMLSGKQSPASAEIGPLGPGFFHVEHAAAGAAQSD